MRVILLLQPNNEAKAWAALTSAKSCKGMPTAIPSMTNYQAGDLILVDFPLRAEGRPRHDPHWSFWIPATPTLSWCG